MIRSLHSPVTLYLWSLLTLFPAIIAVCEFKFVKDHENLTFFNFAAGFLNAGKLKPSFMILNIDEKDLKKFILVGDRILIKPKSEQHRTKSGLYLPPTVTENEKIHSGYVLKVGPGYPIPAVSEEDEPWKASGENVKYVPLQPKEGDLAVYLQNSGWEIEFNEEKYLIVPQSAILMLIRDEKLFE